MLHETVPQQLPELYEAAAKMGGAGFLNAGSGSFLIDEVINSVLLIVLRSSLPVIRHLLRSWALRYGTLRFDPRILQSLAGILPPFIPF